MRVYFFSSIEGLVKVIKEFRYSHGAGRLSSHKCDKIKDLGPEVKNRQPAWSRLSRNLGILMEQAGFLLTSVTRSRILGLK